MFGGRLLPIVLASAALALGCASRPTAPPPPVEPVPPAPEPSETPDDVSAREAEESAERPVPPSPDEPDEPDDDGIWLREPRVVAEILFASGSAELSSSARRDLDALAGELAESSGDWRLEIEGHADGAGDEVVNRLLAAHRADAVRRYLGERHRIPLERIGLRSLGESEPIADDETAGGRALNRRVVVLLGRPPA